MKSIPLAAIANDTYFSDNVFLDDSFQLLDKSVPLTASIKKAMADWSFTVVYTDGSQRTAAEAHAPQTQAQPQVQVNAQLQMQAQKTAAKPEEKKAAVESTSFESIDINDLLGLPSKNNPIVNVPKAPPVPDVPEISRTPGEVYESDESVVDKFNLNDDSMAVQHYKEETPQIEQQRLNNASEAYDTYLEYVDEIFTRYATHKELDYQQISEKVKEMLLYIRDNQRYILRVIPSALEKEKNFLVGHSLRSTVLAIIIGYALALPPPKLIGLGVACLIHEIGQIRLPPQLYMTDRLLTAPEKVQMSKHPIIGYNILKEHNFPLAIQLGVLDHHERENGTGYPRHIKGDKITSFAKIISVACSFEAITAPRLFREERSSYEAMLEMLKNHSGAYDETVTKALLKSLSLFPIGAYVELSCGSIAQVVDVTPGLPKCPKVKLVKDSDPARIATVITTDDNQNKIIRVLNKNEVNNLKKAN